jgi:hypothetical protein
MPDPKPAKRAAIEPRLLNVTEAGRALGGLSARTVREMIADERLESVMIGTRPAANGGRAAGRRMVPVAAIDAYVAKLRAEQSGNGHAAHKRERQTPRTRTAAAARPARRNRKASDA